jgi:UDP-glucose:(heptosyl)LPS alpha-1,3-glucosyltransferase
MIIALEHFIYGRANTARLIAVSRKTHGDLSRHYHYHRKPEISYHGIDTDRFNPEITRTLRALSRESLGLTDQDFVLLLIGNDWKTKGLPTLLRALSILQLPDVKLLVVGRDIRSPYTAAIAQYKLQDRVSFLPIRRDVEFYYAATDVYVGPSLEDAFALPPAEALACGIATIVSSKAGVSEVITDEVNGIVLKDPRNADELASRLRQLYESPALRQQLGMSGVSLARRLTWDNNALELLSVVESVLGTKD